MRFIIHEQPYEKPLGAGLWRYEQDGVPTGAVESWRLSTTPDGHLILRVDLDARAAQSGRSTLYHFTMDPFWTPVQLRYRLWDVGAEVTGTALFEEKHLILIAEQGHERSEQVLPLPPGYVFWFPCSTMLGHLARQPARHLLPGVTLELPEGAAAVGLQPLQTGVWITAEGGEEHLAQGERMPLLETVVRWADQVRTVWLDEDGQARRMQRQDGLTAVETRYVKYQSTKTAVVRPHPTAAGRPKR